MGRGLSTVLCPSPSAKLAFLDALARSAGRGVVYLDFDLLYSGHVASGLMEQPENVLLRRPHSSWSGELAAVVRMVSVAPYVVIVDSLNGMGVMWTGRDGGRLANHSVMLLASLGRWAGTRVVAAAVAEETERGWTMVPGGRRLPGSGETFVLEERRDRLRLARRGAGRVCDIET